MITANAFGIFYVKKKGTKIYKIKMWAENKDKIFFSKTQEKCEKSGFPFLIQK